MEERVDAKINSKDGIVVGGVTPLEIMISTNKEGGVGEALVDSRKRAIIRAVDETIVRTIDL